MSDIFSYRVLRGDTAEITIFSPAQMTHVTYDKEPRGKIFDIERRVEELNEQAKKAGGISI